MPAVSDTSPILSLAIIGHLNLFQEQLGEIYIPRAVLAELKVIENFQGAIVISQALAVDLGFEMIVMDEKIGRERARGLGLKTVGVLGVLLTAKKQGRIKSLKDAMTALRNEVGFFISDDLYRQILAQAGE